MIDAILDWLFMTRVSVVWRKDKQNWAVSVKQGLLGKRHRAVFKTYQEGLDWVKQLTEGVNG